MDYVVLDGDISPLLTCFSERNLFSFDLETTGLNPYDSRILLAQISFKDKHFVMQPSRVDMQKITQYLRDPKWTKIIQNAKFESKFINHFYNVPISNVFDTFLAEQLINSQSRANSLEALASRYMGIALNKDIRKSFFDAKPMTVFSKEQLDYAIDDVIVLHGIYEQQKERINSLGLSKAAELEFSLSSVVASMENEGVPIDRSNWQKQLDYYAQKHEESRLKMNSIIFDGTGLPEQMGLFVRDGIDLGSPKKVREYFLKLGIDIETTNEREISLIDHPAAQELLNYREYDKALNSYGKTFLDAIHPFTNRIHADFQQIGTETGRFSCKRPNLQQMPPEFRECVTLPDHKVVMADFANIELRILAELSQDKAFIAAFESGDDPHKSTAATMFNVPVESVTKDQRFIAKTINFGLAYGMGANKLRDILNAKGDKKLTISEVRSIYSKYKTAYKGAISWLSQAGEQAYAHSFATTMYGRRRAFTRPAMSSGMSEDDFDKQVAAIKRQGANSIIQGTNADITKLSMLNLYHDLSSFYKRSKIIIQVHDEIVVLAHKDEAEAIKQIVIESMQSSAEELIKSVPVKVDANVADVWKKS